MLHLKPTVGLELKSIGKLSNYNCFLSEHFSVGPENIGLYMITAVNESGEARTGATLNAIPAHVLQAGTTTQQHHINRGGVTRYTILKY